jgi:hypothetical protein
MTEQPNPEPILQLGHAFWGAKALLSAVELGVFTTLAKGPLEGERLATELGLHPRAAQDFLDTLVALSMLDRSNGIYRNTPSTDVFLDQAKPSYIGGLLEIANSRLYPLWGSLTEALCTGRPQNEIKEGGNLFDAVYQNPAGLRGFLHAMTGVSMGAANALADKFTWERYKTVIDVGTAEGCVPVQLALRHPHLTGGGFDLPPVEPIFADYVASFGLGDRLRFYAGDFFVDDLPQADVLVFGHILHDWDLDQRLALLAKAYEALPDGGAVIVYDAIIDDDRRTNAFGLLMSLLMLLETVGGANHTAADCRGWLEKVGFHTTYAEPLVGPDSMVIGIK